MANHRPLRTDGEEGDAISKGRGKGSRTKWWGLAWWERQRAREGIEQQR